MNVNYTTDLDRNTNKSKIPHFVLYQLPFLVPQNLSSFVSLKQHKVCMDRSCAPAYRQIQYKPSVSLCSHFMSLCGHLASISNRFCLFVVVLCFILHLFAVIFEVYYVLLKMLGPRGVQ